MSARRVRRLLLRAQRLEHRADRLHLRAELTAKAARAEAHWDRVAMDVPR